MNFKRIKDAISGKNKTVSEGGDMAGQANEGFLGSPFGKFVAALFTMMAGAGLSFLWMNIQKLDALHDSQIRTQTLMEMVIKNQENEAGTINVLTGDVQTLKTKVELHSQRFEEEDRAAQTRR